MFIIKHLISRTLHCNANVTQGFQTMQSASCRSINFSAAIIPLQYFLDALQHLLF